MAQRISDQIVGTYPYSLDSMTLMRDHASAPGLHLQIVFGGRDRAACGAAGIEHAASPTVTRYLPTCAIAAYTEANHHSEPWLATEHCCNLDHDAPHVGLPRLCNVFEMSR